LAAFLVGTSALLLLLAPVNEPHSLSHRALSIRHAPPNSTARAPDFVTRPTVTLNDLWCVAQAK
jgi:hypothetical protein